MILAAASQSGEAAAEPGCRVARTAAPSSRLRWRRRSAAEPLRACSVANSAALLRAVFVWTQPTIAPSSVSTLAANRWWLPNERRRLSPQQYSARLRVNQARSSSGWIWKARASGAETRLQHQLLFQCRGGALDESCSTPANICGPASWHRCRGGQLAVALASINTYQLAVQWAAQELPRSRRRRSPHHHRLRKMTRRRHHRLGEHTRASRLPRSSACRRTMSRRAVPRPRRLSANRRRLR